MSCLWAYSFRINFKNVKPAKEHQQERMRLLMNLIAATRRRGAHTVLLSGDVHVGCLGSVTDFSDDDAITVHQVVSSGIVHPPPTWLQWKGVCAVTNDRDECLNETGTIRTRMVEPQGSSKYIRSRNFVTLQRGIDDKIWVNWHCENDMKPTFGLTFKGYTQLS